MEDIELIRILNRMNPWWETGNVPSLQLEEFKRRDLTKLCERLPERYILALAGPRRVGKTTLLYQLIDYLITEREVLKNQILFLTLDDPFWKSLNVPFDKVLQVYSEFILGCSISDISYKKEKERIFIILDEVQNWNDWELVLKSYYDRRLNIKFVISGSSSPYLLAKSSESLVGRIHYQLVFPFKLLEVSRFKCQLLNKKQDMKELDKFNWEFRKSIENSIEKDSVLEIIEFLNKKLAYWTNKEIEWRNILNDYIVQGGFPEILTQNPQKAREYLRDYVELTIHRDIQRFYREIRGIDNFKKIFFWIIRESSQRSNITNLSNKIGLKRETTQKYLKMLESVYLIRRVTYYSKSTSKVARFPEKFFITDIGIQAAYLSLPLQIHKYDETMLGKIVETLVCDHLTRLKFNLESGLDSSLYYWYDTKTRKEVDLICELFRKPIPFEVKYQNQIRKSDMKGLNKFFEFHENSPFGFILSKKTIDFTSYKKIIILPLWLFLMVP